MTSAELVARLEAGLLSEQDFRVFALQVELAKVQQLEKIARHLENLTELNTHPGFEALEKLAHTLDTIQHHGLTVEKRGGY